MVQKRPSAKPALASAIQKTSSHPHRPGTSHIPVAKQAATPTSTTTATAAVASTTAAATSTVATAAGSTARGSSSARSNGNIHNHNSYNSAPTTARTAAAPAASAALLPSGTPSTASAPTSTGPSSTAAGNQKLSTGGTTNKPHSLKPTSNQRATAASVSHKSAVADPSTGTLGNKVKPPPSAARGSAGPISAAATHNHPVAGTSKPSHHTHQINNNNIKPLSPAAANIRSATASPVAVTAAAGPAAVGAKNNPTINSSATRSTYVDLSKLRKTSLKRYKKHFKLDVKADSKVELLAAVSAHFAAMPVHEADVAVAFHEFVRTLRLKRQQAQQSQTAQLVESNPVEDGSGAR